MYELAIQTSFAAAHRLEHYAGQCEALHGHNWRVEVVVRAAELNSVGIAVDFAELKQATREILSCLDHTLLNELPQFSSCNPSSENIARWLYDQIDLYFADRAVSVTRITVWESDAAWASYLPD